MNTCRWIWTLTIVLTVVGSVLPARATPVLADSGCVNIVVNSDFETTSGWTLNPTEAPATYVAAPNRTGRAMRLGITEEPNRAAYSSITQTVTIPLDATTAELRWDFFAISEDTSDGDWQQMRVTDPSTGATMELLWDAHRDDQTWITAVADMSIYKGLEITLYFGVYNDGVGGKTAMYLDNVILEVCTGVTPTPTPTVEPSATPTTVVLPNVQITTINYNPPGDDLAGEFVQIQNYSSSAVDMTGWTLRDLANNVYTFPTFTLAPGASVRLWTKSGTNTTTDLYWGRTTPVWNNDGDAAFLRNASDLLVATFAYGVVLTPTPTPTQSVTPSPTATMTPMPTATPTHTATPTPTTPAVPTVTPTPTATTPTLPTPVPGACVDLVYDGGFEVDDSAWELHRTPLWPSYVGAPHPVHSGLRSVMLGNPLQPESVSFSSARQVIYLPPEYTTARLQFWYYGVSSDNGGDRQEVLLLDPVYYRRIANLWRLDPPNRDQAWHLMAIDLTPYRGLQVVLYFNVFNDGDGLRTAMYVDDVSIIACGPTPTPSPPTPTSTPTEPLPTPTATVEGASTLSTPTPQRMAGVLTVEETPAPEAQSEIVIAVTEPPADATATPTPTPAPLPTAGAPVSNRFAFAAILIIALLALTIVLGTRVRKGRESGPQSPVSQ